MSSSAARVLISIRIDLETGAILQTLEVEEAGTLRGLAYDGEHLWVSSGTTGKIYQVSTVGSFEHTIEWSIENENVLLDPSAVPGETYRYRVRVEGPATSDWSEWVTIEPGSSE